jgi:Zn-dependent peptidase ImmA (M78 family)
MSTIAVSKDVLLWALDRSGQTIGDVLPVFPRLPDWISGDREPTIRQLEDFARTTHTPLGFLFLPKPPEERMPIPHYRTADGGGPQRPSAELLDTIYAMQLRQAWMRDDVKDQGQEPLPFVRSACVGDPPEAVAQKMRQLLRFKENWAEGERTWTDALRRLREAIEEARILVVVNGIVGNNTHRKLNPGEFRGFVLVDDYAPLMFVNNADGKAAQMFTLAHELVHIFFGSSAAFDLRQLMPAQDKTEQACNKVAAEFLVPGSRLHEAWPVVRDDGEPFQTLARRFKVSEIVVARRALDLGLIGQEAFFAFYKDHFAKERRRSDETSGGGDFYLNQSLRVGTRFGTAVVRAVKEGRLGYTEAYRMTGLYGKTFEHFAASLVIRVA